MKKWTLGLVLGLAIFTQASDFALDALVGSQSPTRSFNPGLDATAHIWWKYDQMVFLGLGGGILEQSQGAQYPAMGSLWLRLPFGGRALPLLTADAGWNFGKSPELFWRYAGGIDLKNGNRSSILFLVGYSHGRETGAAYSARLGLLLEI